MMATDDLELNNINEKTNSTLPAKKPKRGKKNLHSTNSNGIMENGTSSLSESIPSPISKHTEIKRTIESNLETSTDSQPSTYNSNKTRDQLNQPLTPVESSQSVGKTRENVSKHHKVELTTVTDEDDDDERDERKNIQPTDHIITDHDLDYDHGTMVQSYTSGENDIIEIHEFSLADVDAYLDIYFETLSNRLRKFIGETDQLQQFRTTLKNRITSDTNSREYQNVLLGKMNGEVVAAVTLSFPGETTTVSNDNLIPQANSCLTSIRRWMLRKANYIPTNMEECYIEMIGVKKSFQNHGIGAAMLECVEHFAQQAGAHSLTIHTNNDQLRNYFQRFGFGADHTDISAIWKWAVERQTILKMSKPIPPNDENPDHSMDNTSGYVNESIVESEDQ